MPTTLIIDDEPVLARNVGESLTSAGHDTVVAHTGEDGLARAAEHAPDLILLDYRLPSIDGLEVLRRLRADGHKAAVVMMTAHGDIETAVEAMRGGASDFLNKPLDLDQLHLVAERALEHGRVTTNLDYFRNQERTQAALESMLGESEAMQSIKTVIQRIGSSDALAIPGAPSLLITGETGTGKDLAARAVHYAGNRHENQFVHVNCTAIPVELFESELFGHVKGAFTDAHNEKRGLFEVADGGTLFLDEVGHLDLSLQAKLLAALDRSAIRPVGAAKERAVDVHVIAATNRDLEQAIAAGEFREDLFHRLRVLSLQMPPLRRRSTDIPTLANHFLSQASARFGMDVESFSSAAHEALLAYDWPGNVRELAHVVESAVLMVDGPTIQIEQLNLPPAPRPAFVRIELANSNEHLEIDFSDTSLKLEDVEHKIMTAALVYTRNNLSMAARLLGVSRDVIRYRIEKYATRDNNA
jgi:DNA-binding NtrC family response regulator